VRSLIAWAFSSSEECVSQSGYNYAERMAASIPASQSRQTRIRVALSQAGKAKMDAKRETSMASKVVASQPRKTTIKETSIAVSQARQEVALVCIISCVHRLII